MLNRLSHIARNPVRNLVACLVLVLLSSFLLISLVTAAGMSRCGWANPAQGIAAGVVILKDQLAEHGLCLNGNEPRPIIYGEPEPETDYGRAILGGCTISCGSPQWSCGADNVRTSLNAGNSSANELEDWLNHAWNDADL